MKIELRHGSGGEESETLIRGIFARYFQNEILSRMEDGAVLPQLNGNPVFTSDSFVVQPLFFPAGISADWRSAVRLMTCVPWEPGLYT